MLKKDDITKEMMLEFLQQTKQTSIELSNVMGISESESETFKQEICIIDAIYDLIKASGANEK